MGEAPAHFGKYELLETLGSGGMATVYRACVRGPAGAARPVALKLIHPHLSQEREFILMFLEEVRVAMALNHRNIVQTFDAGQQGDRYFMAMELVNGCSLLDLIRRAEEGRLPLDLTLFIAMELCSALQYAHEFKPELTGQPREVIHRDISPGNVLVAQDGSVKLADFGVARATDALVQSSHNLVKGKLAYMAPEQARGRAERRSDLFAVGVVLYEMLTGRMLRADADLEQVLRGPQDLTLLSELRPDLPESLERLVASCLDPDPDARPATAEALRSQLVEPYFQLQVEQGLGADSHARLSEFLGRLPERRERRDPAAARLAAALMDEARQRKPGTGALEAAATEKDPDSTEAATKAEPLRPMAAEPVSATPARGRPRQWPWIAAVLLLVASGGLVTLFLRHDPKDDANPVAATHPVSIDAAPADARRLGRKPDLAQRVATPAPDSTPPPRPSPRRRSRAASGPRARSFSTLTPGRRSTSAAGTWPTRRWRT